MAVLGNRATGLLDMLIEGFKNQTAPLQAGSPMQSPMVADVRRTSPTQRALTQEMGRFNMQNQPLPLRTGERFGQVRAPYAPTGTQMDTPVAPPSMIPTPLNATPTPAQPAVPVNRLMPGREFSAGEGAMQPGMDREQMLRDAEIASKVLETGDESLIDRAKGYFGNRENMVRLALAFNSMRLTPDTGLAAALGSELKTIQEGKATNKTQTAVVNWLKANGYDEYVEVAMQNPKAALEIFKQITQKEFAPGKSPSVSGVQYDADNKAYVVVSENGVPTVEYLGTTRDDPVETERMKGQWELSAKRSDEVSQKAEGLETQLSQYQQAIQAIRNGAETGVIRNRLPAFDRQTATLRSIAQNLGIQVINSATFGALSEKELELALSTTMDLNLPPAELEAQIIAKMQATEKLYLEMRRKAAEMASMPYNEYIKLQNERTKENEKFRKLPEGVDQSDWYSLTMDEKRAYYEAGQ